MKEVKLNFPDLNSVYVIKSDSTVYNSDTGRVIKPYNDPRRPNECPLIYLKLKNGKRLCFYHDKLMCMTFIPNYNEKTMPVIHLNGDVEDCRLENLYTGNGLDILKNIHNETKEWKLVEIEEPLYYEYYICEDGRLFNGTTNSFIKPYADNRKSASYNGYLRYNLYRSKSMNDVLHCSAARLVAMHFIPKQDEYKDNVIYKDNDYSNIDKSNLYWGDNYDCVMKRYENDREFSCQENIIFGREKWKDLEYFDHKFSDEYKISNFGRIYNVTKGFYVSQINGPSNPYNQSYKYVTLNFEVDGFKNIRVHRLVAYNFVKNDDYDSKPCVNHINGNPEFNFAINLEWCSYFSNLHHAIETNLMHYDKKFSDKGKNKKWRLLVFFACAFSTMHGLTIEGCYEFYKMYTKDYNDIEEDLSYAEFVEKYEQAKQNSDYQKLLKFYSETYGKS